MSNETAELGGKHDRVHHKVHRLLKMIFEYRIEMDWETEEWFHLRDAESDSDDNGDPDSPKKTKLTQVNE